LLLHYYFEIVYRPGRENQGADALLRKVEDVATQDKLKKDSRY